MSATKLLRLLLATAVAMTTEAPAPLRMRLAIAGELIGHCSVLGLGNLSRPIGCSSDAGASRGRVVWGLAELSASASASPHEPLVVILSLDEFLRLWSSNFSTLAGASSVKAAIVTADVGQSATSTQPPELPRCGLDDSVDACRSRKMRGLAFSSRLPFPVAVMSNRTLHRSLGASLQQLQPAASLWAELGRSVSKLTNANCYRRQRRLWARHVAEAMEMQWPAGRLCLPAGGQSLVWTAAGLAEGERENRSALLLLARMDAFSVFSNWGSGARQLHPSLKVLLATAAWIADQAKAKRLHFGKRRDVVLLLLNGEDYGLSASRGAVARLLGDSGLFGDANVVGLASLHRRHVGGVLEVGVLESPRTVAVRSLTADWKLAEAMQLPLLKVDAYPPDASLRVFADAFAGSSSSSSDSATPPTALIVTKDEGACAGCSGIADTVAEANDERLGLLARKLAASVAQFVGLSDPDVGDLRRRVERLDECFGLRESCSELFDGVIGEESRVGNLRRWLSNGIAADLSTGAAYGRGAVDFGLDEPLSMRVFLETLLLQLTSDWRRPAHGGCHEANPAISIHSYRHRNGSQFCLRSSLKQIRFSLPEEQWNFDSDDPITGLWMVASQLEFPTLMFYAKPPALREWLTLLSGLLTLMLSLFASCNLSAARKARDAARLQQEGRQRRAGLPGTSQGQTTVL